MKHLLVAVLILMSHNAFAIRLETPFGEVKAPPPQPPPTPQIIKDAGKILQKGATEVVNGVRDTHAAIGNATGVTSVLEHNSETIGHIGRAQACMVAFCYSEYYRKKQIEKQESDQAAALDSESAEFEKNLTEQEAKDRLSLNRDRLRKHLELQSKQNELLRMNEKEATSMKNLVSVTTVEISLRKKLNEVGIQRNQNSNSMVEAAKSFEQRASSTGFAAALEGLDADSQAVAQATGKSIAALWKEAMQLINDSNLSTLNQMSSTRLKKLYIEISAIKLEHLENQVMIEHLEDQIEKGTAK